jgi:hypothetical protein
MHDVKVCTHELAAVVPRIGQVQCAAIVDGGPSGRSTMTSGSLVEQFCDDPSGSRPGISIGRLDQMGQNTNTVDEAKLNQFIGQMLGDLGGASSIAMVRIGDASAGCVGRQRRRST